MMNEEKILTVARYLEGDMELQEKTQFEAVLQADQELQELIARYTDIHQTLKMKIAPSEEDKMVEANLEALNKQYFKEVVKTTAKPDAKPEARVVAPETSIAAPEARVVSIKTYMKWMSVAAILIIGLFVWAPWSASLYEQYAISKKMSVAERGADQPNGLEKAAELYNNSDYAGAKKLLEKEYLVSPENSMVAYYYGVTLVETDRFDQAQSVLMTLYAKPSVFKYDACYYIGLCYVKQGNNKEATFWLAAIPKGTSNYKKAQELVNKLK